VLFNQPYVRMMMVFDLKLENSNELDFHLKYLMRLVNVMDLGELCLIT
jgi:hypothetical protein